MQTYNGPVPPNPARAPPPQGPPTYSQNNPINSATGTGSPPQNPPQHDPMIPVYSQNAEQLQMQPVRGGICPCPPKMLDVQTANFTLCVFMGLFLLFTFCALCVSTHKLANGKFENGLCNDTPGVVFSDVDCGWKEACFTLQGARFCRDYADGEKNPLCPDLDPNKNVNAGNSFLGFAILSFFLEIFMMFLLMNFHGQFIAALNKWTVHFGCACGLWLLTTISWGAWVNQNICTKYDGMKQGDGTNLMITVWFFLMVFYLPLSIPRLQVYLFGHSLGSDSQFAATNH